MKKLLNERIPTILGIVLIMMGVPLTIFFLKNQTIFKSRASDSQNPKNVKITNISAQSFTITYQTDLPSTGSVNYDSNKQLGKSALEDIDKKKNSFSPKTIHSISVGELIPSTKYYLAIISGSNTFLNNGAPFEITTGPSISSSSAQENILKGKILLPNGNAPSQALVYVNAQGSQTLSSAVADNGEFSFSLKELRTDDLSSYFNVQDSAVFKIFATDGSLESTALASLDQTEIIPTITLSNDYDFTQEISPLASKSAQPLGFPSIALSSKISKPKILSPKDKQSFSSQKPQFNGISLPNEKVDIVIHSAEEITTQVTADKNGNWTYQPSSNLAPGDHTITIKTRDSSGILTTITQAFTVYAAEIPTPTATPSATPTPTILPTSTPIPTSIPIPTPSPTITPSPLPSPVIVPIVSKGGLPPTGNSPIALTITGIAVTAIGTVLFLFAHTIL